MQNPRIRHKGPTIENTQDRIIIAAHRGWSARYPENTMAAYGAALKQDIDELEIDIHLTRDGVPVLIHDAAVDRTTDGTGPVSALTLAELKKLDAGSWKGPQFAGERIPTVEELFSFLLDYPGILLNVEIKQKTTETVDKTMALIGQYGLTERIVITCFDAGIIHYAVDTYHVKCQGFPAPQLTGFREGPGGTYEKMYSVGVDDSLLSEYGRDFFDGLGIRYWTYCPDTEEMVKRHLAAGAQLMTCNEIMPSITVLREMGLR